MWINVWLNDRKQRVIRGTVSGQIVLVAPVIGGLRGAVTGSLLLIIYINDLHYGMNCKLNNLAHDKNRTHNRNRLLLCGINAGSKRLYEWSNEWMIMF